MSQVLYQLCINDSFNMLQIRVRVKKLRSDLIYISLKFKSYEKKLLTQ